MTIVEDREDCRVLFVEDNAGFRQRILRKYLYECEVVELSDGKSFIDQLQDGDYQLVLMDYELPDATGEELVRKARETGYSGGIIGVSSSEYLNRKLLQAGADVTVEKRKSYQLPMVIRQALAISNSRNSNP